MLEQGKYYHIYNRGNNREDLFKEEKNYEYFLKLYAHHIDPVAETFAYCLMKHHFHLLIRIKEIIEPNTSQVLESCEVLNPVESIQKLPNQTSKNASQSFSNLFNAYSKAINKTYNRTGSLFQDRFRRIEITSDVYSARLVHYIHFNPQHHGFTDNYRTYPHSSYQLILSDMPAKLKKAEVINWFGGRNDFVEFHNTVTKEKEIISCIGDDE
jgi:putative transposase